MPLNQYRLNLRKTHRYVDGWARECDEWAYIGTVQVLNRRIIEEAEDYETLDTSALTVRVDARPGATADEIAQALRDTFTASGCRHEHDCCGCASVHVDKVRHVKAREYIVIQSGYRNL